MPFFAAIGAAIAAVGAWFGSLAPIAQFAVRIGASLALNALASALAQPNRPRPGGIVGEIGQGADLPRSFIMGRYATAGSLVYHNAWGQAGKTPNAFYTRVTALSDLPVAGLVEVWIDGERCTLDTGNPDADGRGFPVVEYAGFAWVKFYDGTQTTADAFLQNDVASAERPWGADRIGTGVAYAIATFRFSRSRWQGFPRVVYVVDGIAMYDAHADDTGTADDIPAVQAYAILDGISYGGSWFYGPQGSGAGRLDDAEWAAEIAKCKAAVPGAAGMSDAEKIDAFGSTTVPARYRSGREVSVDEEPINVLNDLASACNGRFAEVGTRWRFQVGDPGSSAATITDGDILATEGQTFAPFFPLAETVNSVSATYPEPDEGWQTQEAPPLIVAAYEAEEGGRRLPTTADLKAVPYREQVQRLMAAALAEARRARRHTLTLPARFWALEVGDYLTWTSARNGYDGKLFRIDGLTDLPAGDILIDVTEVDPADYSWTASSDYTTVTPGTVTPLVPPAAQLTGFTVTGTAVTDASSVNRRPALLLAWTDDLDDVRAVAFEIRVQATGAVIVSGSTDNVEAGEITISEAILADTAYEARARYLPFTGRATEWSDWEAATTPDLKIGAPDLRFKPNVPIWPIDMEVIKTTEAAFTFKHLGLAEVFVLGGGGGGGVAIRHEGAAAASGGGAGGLARKFVIVTDLALTYAATIGAAGAGSSATSTASADADDDGAAGGASSFVGHGLNLVANGGAGGLGRAVSSPSAAGAAGGTASGGDDNFTGGASGTATAASNAAAATGGGSINMGLFSGAPTSADVNVSGSGNTTGGAGGWPLVQGLREAKACPIPFMYFEDFNWTGKNAVAQVSSGTVVGPTAPDYASGGGAAAQHKIGTDARSLSGSAGGPGIIFVVYYGDVSLDS